MLRIATAQLPITSDPETNAAAICDLIREAAASGADCIHFPEAALSGYVKTQIKSWSDVDWKALDASLNEVRACCAETGIWAFVGCNHRHPEVTRPLNSLHIIDGHGHAVARYDKQYCSNSEITDWYAAGNKPITVDIKGIRLGFLICIEVQFPELFMEYERLGVDCLCLSSGPGLEMFRIQCQGHAASNCFWLSYSVPENGSEKQPSCFIGPDGEILASCGRAASGLVLGEIDPTNLKWDIPVNKARPWRCRARIGEIYREHRLKE
ncbi:carbon-nitrogen hydrolase family protein [Nisaea nitritireducens]|uniref:carbon-nitrogen hydrolase family protein n=1 Tax=Nisaea nitritireducens TaxID=568392 RepID=UPI001867B4EB|nr:carbon-nitrogen hydrolase family protein [Nisaea nitritireducens]